MVLTAPDGLAFRTLKESALGLWTVLLLRAGPSPLLGRHSRPASPAGSGQERWPIQQPRRGRSSQPRGRLVLDSDLLADQALAACSRTRVAHGRHRKGSVAD